MDTHKPSRREFLRNLLVGTAAAIAPLEAIAKRETTKMETSAIYLTNHSSNRFIMHDGGRERPYILMAEGYLTEDKIKALDRVYTRLEEEIQQPTVINNRVSFDNPSSKVSSTSALYKNHFDRVDYGGQELIKYCSKISVYVGESKEVFTSLLHEFGHSWFNFMECMVSPEWVAKFNKRNFIPDIREVGYSPRKWQDEIHANAFKDYFTMGLHKELFKEGFSIYNDFVNSKRSDPRVRMQ